MKWRVIEKEAYSAAMNMAIDHAICESMANGRENPTIRFYKWKNSSVSLGAYQNPKEINIDFCEKNGIEIVRRMTGGRSVFHSRNDFTYSVIAHIRNFDYRIGNAYSQICSCIINALKDLGINADLENKNDIIVNGKKISGNASKLMDKGIYLQHGTLIYDIDLKLMPEALNISKDSVKNKVTAVPHHTKINKEKFYTTLKSNFTKDKDFKTEELSKYELMRTEDLAKTKYSYIMLPAGTLVKNKGVCYVERGKL